MLKPEQIPPDAMYAAWKCMNAGMTLNDAIAAALNAWPGMHIGAPWVIGVPNAPSIILPLTEKPNNQSSTGE